MADYEALYARNCRDLLIRGNYWHDLSGGDSALRLYQAGTNGAPLRRIPLGAQLALRGHSLETDIEGAALIGESLSGDGLITFGEPAWQNYEFEVTAAFLEVRNDSRWLALVVRAAQNVDRKLITSVTVFDVYEGKGIEPGKKSIAIAVTLQPRDKTMTDQEIEALGQKIAACYQAAYANEPFVRVLPLGQFPNVRNVRGSNFCDIGVHADPRTGRAVVVTAIDNLVKGGAGQAIQNMNLMFGQDETTGLWTPAIAP